LLEKRLDTLLLGGDEDREKEVQWSESGPASLVGWYVVRDWLWSRRKVGEGDIWDLEVDGAELLNCS
jgi:hypothetical protein